MKKKRRFRTKYLLLLLLFFPLMAEIPRPDREIKEFFGFDGWSVMHYFQGNIYARVRSSETINGWVGLKPPPNHQIFIENLAIALTWEVYEFGYDGKWDWKYYNDFYDGRALFLNGVDVGLSTLGCLVSMRYGRIVPKIKRNSVSISYHL